jgi:hypothetical protein
MNDPQFDRTPQSKVYETPAVIYEAPLEVRAGTPFGLVDTSDPAGLFKKSK